ncbi:MAG: [acyl-carrier-protein] S-malonyltransferase [Kiritimatiellia bacterium]|jgi:[acyl-carrier-protein] S-malonyltransferase
MDALMGTLGILYPGQGAQAVGMGKDLVEGRPVLRARFDEASDILGFDLAKVCFDGPEEELKRSDRAQPAIFVHSVIARDALRSETGLEVSFVAGLSSGEWAALYDAGVVSYADALKVLEARGRLMQQACSEQAGGMLSVIGLADEKLAALAETCGVELANFNSPGQTVLSGPIAGIEKAGPLAKEAGAKLAVQLDVAGAFHSSLMSSAAEAFAEVLSQITLNEPTIPVFSNVSGDAHTGVAEIPSAMVAQITSSVQWVKNVQSMIAAGTDTFVECGPGKILTGLVKRIDKTPTLHNIYDLQSLERTVESLTSA